MRKFLYRPFFFFSSAVLLVPSISFAAQNKRAAGSTEVSFSEPTLGHVFDAAKGKIRSVLGVPGAARVADPIPLDGSLLNGVLGSSGPYAIVSQDGADHALLVRLTASDPGAAVTAVPITDAMKQFQVAAFSPTSKAAVLWGSDCKCLQVANAFGEDETPAITRTVDVSALLGDVTAVAVNDDASIAAVAAAAPADGSNTAQIFYYDLTGDATPRLLAGTSSPALAFSLNGKDLAIADTANQTVWLAQDVLSGNGTSPIVGPGDGLSMPTGVTFLDSSNLLIADRVGQAVLVNLGNKQVTLIPCNCRPNTVEPMELKSTYRLTGIDTGSLWVITFGDTETRVRFVPVEPDPPAADAVAGDAQ